MRRCRRNEARPDLCLWGAILGQTNRTLIAQAMTGVAQAAADMILMAFDLEIVADGVEEGRPTFVNILKYVRMGASSNFGNMLWMAAEGSASTLARGFVIERALGGHGAAVHADRRLARVPVATFGGLRRPGFAGRNLSGLRGAREAGGGQAILPPSRLLKRSDPQDDFRGYHHLPGILAGGAS
jgi:hypothetical protein